MFQRHAVERPQRILTPLGQGSEALAAEYDVGMGETGEGQPDVMQPMIVNEVGNHDGQDVRVGEIGQTETAERALMSEQHILLAPG